LREISFAAAAMRSTAVSIMDERFTCLDGARAARDCAPNLTAVIASESEAIQSRAKDWIASSQVLLAMTR
jgi:hypothetical protein